jgi:hypothetical protein
VLKNSTYQEQTEWDQISGVSGQSSRVEVTPISMNITSGPNSSLIKLASEGVVNEYWLTENAMAVKTSIDSPRQPPMYMYHNTGEFREFQEAPSDLLHEWLNSSTYDYTGPVTRDNQTLHEFWATGPRGNTTPVEDVHARVLVDHEGVIHDAVVVQTFARDNETVTGRLNYALQRNGTAPPREPDWVTAELPHLDASVIGNGTVIALEHSGGTPIPNATMKTFFSDRTHTDTEIQGFEPGDTLYLYRLQGAPDQLHVSENEAPTANESFVPVGEDSVLVSVFDRFALSPGGNESLLIEVEPRES